MKKPPQGGFFYDRKLRSGRHIPGHRFKRQILPRHDFAFRGFFYFGGDDNEEGICCSRRRVFSSLASAHDSGLLTRPSKYSVAETAERMDAAIKASGAYKVFFRLEHTRQTPSRRRA